MSVVEDALTVCHIAILKPSVFAQAMLPLLVSLTHHPAHRVLAKVTFAAPPVLGAQAKANDAHASAETLCRKRVARLMPDKEWGCSEGWANNRYWKWLGVSAPIWDRRQYGTGKEVVFSIKAVLNSRFLHRLWI